MELELINQKFKKGDYITKEELEKAVGGPLTWKQQLNIWGRFASMYGELGITVISNMGGIRFLTDSESHIYNHNGSDAACRKLERHLMMMRRIDASNLTDAEKQAHEKSILLNALRLIGIQDAEKRVSIEYRPHKTDKSSLPLGEQKVEA